MHLGEVEIHGGDPRGVKRRGERPGRPLEGEQIALGHGEDVLHVRHQAERHGPLEVGGDVVRDEDRAAAPSEISEQSVTRSGSATIGFLSDTVLQKSKPTSLRMSASGLFTPLRWFFAAIWARSP